MVRETIDNCNMVAITKNGMPTTVMLSMEQYDSIR